MIELSNDNKTVWINKDGSCIGRFSHRGFEVNQPIEATLNGNTQAFDSAYGLPFEQSWNRFKTSMSEFHGYEVPDSSKPLTRS